jgi:tRNA 2-thiouridine synthesizing protein A
MSNRYLDTSGLTCPIPILKAKKALNDMAPGALLEVIATDPAAPRDFEAFCKASGNALEGSSQDGDRYTFLIRRSP